MNRINYKARYFIFESPSGERIVVDRSDYMPRYRKMARGFINYTQFNGYVYYKHVTLTQATESYKPRHLHYFFSALKRRYGDVKYIWTAEVQEERLQKYGEPVLHWHVILAFPPGTDITPDDIARMQKYWKHGNLNIRSVQRLSLSYLLKYMYKALSFWDVDYEKMKRISTSYIPQLYRYVKAKIIKAIEWAGYNLDRLFRFYRVDAKGIYYKYWDDLWKVWRKDYMLVLSPSWRLVDSRDGEPF